MIQTGTEGRILELLEQLLAHVAMEHGPAVWYPRRLGLQANRPDRLILANVDTRKWRIRRETAAANVRLSSSPNNDLSAAAGALLNDARPELEDRAPFVHKGDVWAIADADCVLTVEVWAAPAPYGR